MVRLTKKEWGRIKKLLGKRDRNISQIAKDFNISRHSVYDYSWNNNFPELKKKKGRKRKKKKLGFWKRFFRGFNSLLIGGMGD